MRVEGERWEVGKEGRRRDEKSYWCGKYSVQNMHIHPIKRV